MTDLAVAGVAETARLIRDNDVTAVDVVQAALARIEARNGPLNAFTNVLADQALADAQACDVQLGGGAEVGPLHGVPIAIKEEIDVAGTVTTFGGRGNSTPAGRDAEVVTRLRQAGAVV